MSEVSPKPAKPNYLGGSQPLLLGYSVRALAQSVADAVDQAPCSCDAFGDQDTLDTSASAIQVDWTRSRFSRQNIVERCQAMLEGLVESSSKPYDPPFVLLAGGTENWPRLIAELAKRFTVLGPSEGQMRALRQPKFWKVVAEQSGLQFPESFFEVPSEPSSEWWAKPFAGLWKPLTGAGGVGIQRISDRAALLEKSRNEAGVGYFQQEILGRNLGVSFCLSGHGDDQSRVQLLGVTESWTAADWPAPTSFLYRGSWGPIELSAAQVESLLRLGGIIQEQTGLVGWLHVDLIEDFDGRLWLLEVNPRWAAGMEVLQRAGREPVKHHLNAWLQVKTAKRGDDPLPHHAEGPVTEHGNSELVFAKAVLYAENEIHLARDRLAALHQLSRDAFADLPSASMAGSIIGIGQPILTVGASAPRSSPEQARQKLLDQLGERRTQALSLLTS